jgi:MATE family multidrug resistance protein
VALGTLIAQWLAAAASMMVMVRLTGAGSLGRAVRSGHTWLLSRFRRLLAINGFIFVRTVFLMTALAVIMRVAGALGEAEMAASHVVNQYMMLMALGLDGFAHAAEALAGRAWGSGSRKHFRQWVVRTSWWALGASGLYAAVFWLGGNAITGLLTDIESVRASVDRLMPLVILLPVVSVWCYQFDGIYIAATAAAAMMATMAAAFALYLAVLGPMTSTWGLPGLWGAVLVFMAARGLAQAAWYPFLERSLDR